MKILEIFKSFYARSNKLVLFGLLFLAFFICAEFYFHNEVSKLLTQKAKQEVQKNNIEVSFSTADYGYFPPHVSLKNLSYKNETLLVNAKSVSLSVSVLDLIRTKLSPHSLYLDGVDASVKINTGKDSSDKKILADISLQKILGLIPLKNIYIKDSDLFLLERQNLYQAQIEKAHLEKTSNSLKAIIKSQVLIKNDNINENVFFVSKLKWSKSGFFINYITLQKKDSIIQASGLLKNSILDYTKINPKKIYTYAEEARLNIDIDLAELDSILRTALQPYIQAKNADTKFSGRLQGSGYFYDSEIKTNNQSSSLNLQVKQLKSPFTQLHALKIRGSYDGKSLKTKEFQISTDKDHHLFLNDFTIEQKNKSFYLSADVKTQSLNIRDVLSSLNLDVKNLSLPLSMEASCGGVLSPRIAINCDGSSRVFNLDIWDSSFKSKIISTHGADLEFSGKFFKDHITFGGTAQSFNEMLTTSQGQAEGSIDYVKGFDIKFSSPNLDLKMIKEIAGQKLIGQVQVDGSTQGSSSWGKFKIETQAQKAFFNEIYLGKNSFLLNYAHPLLSFNKMEGEILNEGNKYSGSLGIDIEKESLNLNLEGQDVTEAGIRKTFLNLFELPEGLKLQSDFSLQASNSLDINKLDLQLDADLKKVDVFGEKFKTGRLRLAGKKGIWKVQEGLLNKDLDARFVASGFLEGIQKINVEIKSEKFDAKQSDFLRSIGVIVSGPTKFNLSAQGPVEGPKADGQIFSRSLEGTNNKNLGSVDLYYRLFQDDFYFKGKAFNQSFSGEGHYPLSQDGRLSFNGSLNKLDLFSFLKINQGDTSQTKFLVSGDANLMSPKLSTTKAQGELKNGLIELESENKSLLVFKQNSKTQDLNSPLLFKTHQLGASSDLKLKVLDKNRLLAQFSGLLHLDFLLPLIPETELISGNLKSDGVEFYLSPEKVKMTGSAKIEDAIYKSSIFPYSVNGISSQVEFRENKISLSQISSVINDTPVTGKGHLIFKPQSWLLDFVFNYKELSLEFPEKIKSFSSGQIHLKGDHIPLILGGVMNIHSGLFAVDLLSTSSTEVVSPNKRLPKNILLKSTPPVELDLLLKISKKMRVENNEASGLVYGEVRASQNPSDPILNGRIYLVKGLEISFNGNDFTLNEGYVDYKNDFTTEPTVLIDAVSVIKDSNDPLESVYEVRMIAKGLAKDPDIKFLSSPPLPENQIVSLLTIGTVTTQKVGSEINTQNQATYSGLQVGSYLVQKNQALRDLQKRTGTEIGLSSSVNAGGVSPKVYVKKSWSPRTSSTISQSFGNQRSFQASTEYKLNKQTSTVIKIENTQVDETNQFINRRNQEDVILDLGIQYKFEFD